MVIFHVQVLSTFSSLDMDSLRFQVKPLGSSQSRDFKLVNIPTIRSQHARAVILGSGFLGLVAAAGP